MKPSLIILDFDGVVVDSEGISSQGWVKTLVENGVPIDLNEMLLKYSGRSGKLICEEVELKYNCRLPPPIF